MTPKIIDMFKEIHNQSSLMLEAAIDCEKTNVTLNNKIKIQFDDIRNKHARIKNLELSKFNQITEIRDLNDIINEEQESKQRLRKEIEELQQDYDRLREENEKTSKKNEELQRDNDRLRDEKKTICQQNEELQRDYDRLREENETICLNNEELHEQNNRLRDENETMCQHDDELSQINDMQRRLNESQSQLEALRQDYGSLQHSKDAQCHEYRQEIKRLLSLTSPNDPTNCQQDRSNVDLYQAAFTQYVENTDQTEQEEYMQMYISQERDKYDEIAPELESNTQISKLCGALSSYNQYLMNTCSELRREMNRYKNLHQKEIDEGVKNIWMNTAMKKSQELLKQQVENERLQQIIQLYERQNRHEN